MIPKLRIITLYTIMVHQRITSEWLLDFQNGFTGYQTYDTVEQSLVHRKSHNPFSTYCPGTLMKIKLAFQNYYLHIIFYDS